MRQSKYLITSDWHLGVKRLSGTTPESQKKLRGNLQIEFNKLLMSNLDKNIIIAGDLFDGFDVDNNEVIECYLTLANWLSTSENHLYLIAGNHDWSPKGDKMSSFHMLAKILKDRFDNVGIIDTGLCCIEPNLYCISHVANQEAFDKEITRFLEYSNTEQGKFTPFSENKDNQVCNLIIHSNIMNKFTEDSKQSLNLSKNQIDILIDANIRVITGHEHQSRNLYGGKVVCMGNPIPSSIMDCIGSEGKYAYVLHEDESITKIQTWIPQGNYIEIPWQSIQQLEHQCDFIRVVGDADSSSSSDVISTISKFRVRSTSLIISNAVKIQGIEGLDEMGEINFESMSKFDVWNELIKHIANDEVEALIKLMENEDVTEINT